MRSTGPSALRGAPSRLPSATRCPDPPALAQFRCPPRHTGPGQDRNGGLTTGLTRLGGGRPTPARPPVASTAPPPVHRGARLGQRHGNDTSPLRSGDPRIVRCVGRSSDASGRHARRYQACNHLVMDAGIGRQRCRDLLQKRHHASCGTDVAAIYHSTACPARMPRARTPAPSAGASAAPRGMDDPGGRQRFRTTSAVEMATARTARAEAEPVAHRQVSRPLRIASATAAARSDTPSFSYRCCICVLIVEVLRKSCRPISGAE